jgi:hypothetical protein
MTRTPMLASTVLLGLAVLLAVPTNAHAYLDPGSGSYILQVALAMLVGSAFAVKSFWRQIAAFVSTKIFRKAPKNDDSNPKS